MADVVVTVARRIGMSAILLSGVMACQKWQGNSAVPRPGVQVMITYREPRDVTVQPRGAESFTVRGVRRVHGVVERTAPDTLYVRIFSTDQVRGSPIAFTRNGVAAVIRGDDVSVAQRVTNRGKTFAAVLLSVAAIGALVAILSSGFEMGMPVY